MYQHFSLFSDTELRVVSVLSFVSVNLLHHDVRTMLPFFRVQQDRACCCFLCICCFIMLEELTGEKIRNWNSNRNYFNISKYITNNVVLYSYTTGTELAAVSIVSYCWKNSVLFQKTTETELSVVSVISVVLQCYISTLSNST